MDTETRRLELLVVTLRAENAALRTEARRIHSYAWCQIGLRGLDQYERNFELRQLGDEVEETSKICKSEAK
jgi:hypothetical protein